VTGASRFRKLRPAGQPNKRRDIKANGQQAAQGLRRLRHHNIHKPCGAGFKAGAASSQVMI
jgi:hypothetical protein